MDIPNSTMSRCTGRKSLLVILTITVLLVFIYQKFMISFSREDKHISVYRKELSRTYRRKHVPTLLNIGNMMVEKYAQDNNELTNLVSKPFKRKFNMPNVVGKMIRNDIFEDNGEIKQNEIRHVVTVKNDGNFPRPVVYNVSYENDKIVISNKESPTTSNIDSGKYNKSDAINATKDVSALTTLASLNYRVFKTPEKEIMTFTEVSCEPIYPKVLLYNRIFKTGSSSVSRYIKDAINGSGIVFFKGTTEDWYKAGDPYPYPELIEYLSSKNDSSVFNAHFYFRKDLHIDKSFTYINILRHPVSRVISHFQYMRAEGIRPKNRLQEFKDSGLWNETILDCIRHQHRACEDNVMTRFLCGTKSYCKKGTKKALKRAKFNINRYYASIGIYEKLDLTMKIFQRRLPLFFNSYQNLPVSLPRVKANLQKSDYNETVKNAILQRNKADMRLYKYATKIFNNQLRVCGL